jgi:hypothetical protein
MAITGFNLRRPSWPWVVGLISFGHAITPLLEQTLV